MTKYLNPIASRATLGDHLRRKSRNRREGQERMALASLAHRRRNDMLPRLELSYVPLGQLRPSARKLRLRNAEGMTAGGSGRTGRVLVEDLRRPSPMTCRRRLDAHCAHGPA